MRDEDFLKELWRAMQSGQIKTALDEVNASTIDLNRAMAGFKSSVMEFLPLMSEMNKRVSETGLHIKEIAELNRSAKRLTGAMLGFMVATIGLVFIQAFAPLVENKTPVLIIGLILVLAAPAVYHNTIKETPS